MKFSLERKTINATDILSRLGVAAFLECSDDTEHTCMDAPYELGDSTSRATQLDKTPNLPLPLSTAVVVSEPGIGLGGGVLMVLVKLLTRALEVLTSALALLA